VADLRAACPQEADELMCTITTHVLDSALGMPAAGVPVRLLRDGEQVAAAVTDADGRTGQLGPAGLPAGRYRLLFDTGAYFAAAGRPAFYPEVMICFETADPDSAAAEPHYHVPLLLSPFGYTTYRGS
jgi:5-hydroxyisourate hydrolase